MSKCIVIGGAKIENYAVVSSEIRPDDYVIYCDSGLAHQERLGRLPDLVVGDFDSHPKPDVEVETIVLPREKDDTDTVFAVKEGIKRGYKEFLLAGVVGQRLDHTLGNVSILLMLDTMSLHGRIIDDYSEMEILSRQTAYIPSTYSYFSLLNISGKAKGVTERNVKFPLENAEITCDYQYGISNEVLPGMIAEVSVESGRLLLIKIFGNK